MNMKRLLRVGDVFRTYQSFGKIKKLFLYVVVSTRMSGGGKCHNDSFPDAHTVTAHPYDEDSGAVGEQSIEFYQSDLYSPSLLPEHIDLCARVKIKCVYKTYDPRLLPSD